MPASVVFRPLASGNRFAPSNLLAMLSVARQRRQLARLDDAQRRDLGLSESDVLREAQRPFWDVPNGWTR